MMAQESDVAAVGPVAERGEAGRLPPKRKKWHRNNVEVFIMAMAGLLFLAVFSYAPMVGIILAFKDADNTLDLFGAMFGGEWAQMHGFFNFYRFVTDIDFWNVILNTLGFNILNLVITLPLPVILALMFSEMKHARLSKGIQFFMFLPHFLSIVVYVGIVWAMLDDGYGGGVGGYQRADRGIRRRSHQLQGITAVQLGNHDCRQCPQKFGMGFDHLFGSNHGRRCGTVRCRCARWGKPFPKGMVYNSAYGHAGFYVESYHLTVGHFGQ